MGLIAKRTLDETGLSHKNAAVSKHLIQLTQGVLMVNWNPITRQRLINSPTHVSCPHVWTELDPGHLVITKERFKIPYNHYRSSTVTSGWLTFSFVFISSLEPVGNISKCPGMPLRLLRGLALQGPCHAAMHVKLEGPEGLIVAPA